MATPLIILGAVGNCLDILDAVMAANAAAQSPAFAVQGFLDDDVSRRGRRIREVPVLGPLSMARDMPEVLFVGGIGSPRNYDAKAALIDRLGLARDRFATVIHPTAVVSPSATLGRGSVVLANCTICANVHIGDHVMMLPNCVVGHDTSVGDYSILAAGVAVSGSVTVGCSCYLGVGASIRDSVSLGDKTLLGMGAALICDTPEGSVMVGNPARPLKR